MIRSVSCVAALLLALQGSAQAARGSSGPLEHAAIDVFAGEDVDPSPGEAIVRGLRNRRNNNARRGRMGGGGMNMKSRKSDNSKDESESRTATIKVTNLARSQPLSEFYVHAHNGDAVPLFELGKAATDAFAVLAEEGEAEELVKRYVEVCPHGIKQDSISIEALDGPQGLGQVLEFDVKLSEEYPLLSFASMFINSNDGFVGIAGLEAGGNMTIYVSGYDAGTEMNNELCPFIPGPACPEESGNARTPDAGEGVVYIHSGIHGIKQDSPPGNLNLTDLNPALYDWRNPMIKVEISVAAPHDAYYEDYKRKLRQEEALSALR